jgi:hypothetical protein
MQSKYNDKVRNNSNSSNSRRQHLKNCCVVTIANNQRVVFDNLLSSLKDGLSEAEYGSITQVGQYLSIKNWLIQFNSDNEYESALNKNITMNGTEARLIDAQEFDKKKDTNAIEQKFLMTVYYKINWLPQRVSVGKIQDFFKQNLSGVEIKDISREKDKCSDIIYNGIVKIKMVYETDKHQRVLDFAGLHRIDGCQVLIQVSGMPPKCLGCKNYGHIRQNCPKCAKCNGRGHDSNQCNFANRFRSKENQANADDSDTDDDDMNEYEAPVVNAGVEAEAKDEEAAVAEAGEAAAAGQSLDSPSVTLSSNTILNPPVATAAVCDEDVIRGNDEEPIIVKVIESTPTAPAKFSLITADSKIFKQPINVEVKKEVLDKNQQNKAKQKEYNDKAYQKRKEKITQSCLEKFAEQESKRRQIAKEQAVAEFEAMNAQAKREALKPFQVAKSKAEKTAGSELSSSSKLAALDETTDYDQLESDC